MFNNRLLDMGLGPQVAEIVEFLKTNCGGKPPTDSSKMLENLNITARPTGTHLNKPKTESKEGETTAEKKEEVKPQNKKIKFEYDDGYVPKKEVVLEG